MNNVKWKIRNSSIRKVIQRSCLLLLPFLLFANDNVRAQDAPAESWSQFRGSQNLTGVSRSALPATLKLLWTWDAGDSIESSAAIVNGTVFAASQKGELVALNLYDGNVFWRYNAGKPIGESSPAHGNGVVYVGDLGGVLHAINALDGTDCRYQDVNYITIK